MGVMTGDAEKAAAALRLEHARDVMKEEGLSSGTGQSSSMPTPSPFPGESLTFLVAVGAAVSQQPAQVAPSLSIASAL